MACVWWNLWCPAWPLSQSLWMAESLRRRPLVLFSVCLKAAVETARSQCEAVTRSSLGPPCPRDWPITHPPPFLQGMTLPHGPYLMHCRWGQAQPSCHPPGPQTKSGHLSRHSNAEWGSCIRCSLKTEMQVPCSRGEMTKTRPVAGAMRPSLTQSLCFSLALWSALIIWTWQLFLFSFFLFPLAGHCFVFNSYKLERKVSLGSICRRKLPWFQI